MKPFVLLPLAGSVLALACGSGETPGQTAADTGYKDLQARVAAATGNAYAMNEAAVDDPYQASALAGGAHPSAAQQPADGQFRTVVIRNSGFNVPVGRKLVPMHWKELPDGSGYEAPGVTVRSSKATNFIHVTGPMAQFYQQAGSSMRPPMTAEQVVQADLAPRLQQQGYRLVAQSDLPDVERVNQLFQQQLGSMAGTSSVRVNLSEWRKGDTRLAVILNVTAYRNSEMTNWYYSTERLETGAGQYEQERNAFLKSAASVQYNPAFFAAFRQQQQQSQAQWQQNENARSQQSWAAHNQRMQANQAAFNAQQATHNDMVNSVNSSIMGGYNSTMNSMDNMQNATINGIRGEQDAYNPYTGQQGKVQSGYDQYWMNSDGQYIGTNDVMYDPNANGQWVDQWRQAPTEP